jgi:hypothetical protein
MQGVTGRRCVIGADLANKWIKAQITAAEAAGDPGEITETHSVQVKDRPGNPNVDFMARNPLGLSFTFDREYIKCCAANAAEGIQKKADSKEETWDETLATFDVKAYAKEVKSAGAGYVIFALGQNSSYYCAPNAAADLRKMLLAHWETSGRPGASIKALKVPHRMEAMHRDLKAAGIAKKDERGKIVDFHSLRHSFAQRLKESGVPFAVAMRMMRQGDPKLLASVYGDQDAYALADQAAKLPALSNCNQWSRDSSPDLGFSGHFVAKPVASDEQKTSTQDALCESLRRTLALLGGTCQMAPAVGIEPTT